MTTHVQSDTLARRIAAAKAAVIATGRTNVHRYICRTRDGYETMDAAQYEEWGSEENCVAVVWSYEDGKYDDKNIFHPNGKIAAAVEDEF